MLLPAGLDLLPEASSSRAWCFDRVVIGFEGAKRLAAEPGEAVKLNSFASRTCQNIQIVSN